MDEETEIRIESGVSMFDGSPFCGVFVNGAQVGQMTPDEVRQMALTWLEAAEAAEHDALVVAELRDMEAKEQTIAAFLQALRARRVS